MTLSDRILAVTVLKLFPAKVTPNQITIFRFFSIPFIAGLLLTGNYVLGIILFVISAFSDALDGALARTRDQVTDWGKTYDPLADKLLIGLTAFLIVPKYLGVSLVFALVLIEMILIGTAYYFKNKKGLELSANFWGKSKMVCQSFGVGLVMLYSIFPVAFFLPLAQIILYVAIALAFISLITYSV